MLERFASPPRHACFPRVGGVRHHAQPGEAGPTRQGGSTPGVAQTASSVAVDVTERSIDGRGGECCVPRTTRLDPSCTNAGVSAGAFETATARFGDQWRPNFFGVLRAHTRGAARPCAPGGAGASSSCRATVRSGEAGRVGRQVEMAMRAGRMSDRPTRSSPSASDGAGRAGSVPHDIWTAPPRVILTTARYREMGEDHQAMIERRVVARARRSEEVADAIARALETSRPRLRYPVGWTQGRPRDPWVWCLSRPEGVVTRAVSACSGAAMSAREVALVWEPPGAAPVWERAHAGAASSACGPGWPSSGTTPPAVGGADRPWLTATRPCPRAAHHARPPVRRTTHARRASPRGATRSSTTRVSPCGRGTRPRPVRLVSPGGLAPSLAISDRTWATFVLDLRRRCRRALLGRVAESPHPAARGEDVEEVAALRRPRRLRSRRQPAGAATSRWSVSPRPTSRATSDAGWSPKHQRVTSRSWARPNSASPHHSSGARV